MTARQMALCGMLTALAAAFLALGSLIPFATFCAPLLAMAALLPVLEECGDRAASAAWAAVFILGLLLAADREAALVYAFFGWYPVLRPWLERIPFQLPRLAAKLAVFCAAAALLYGIVIRFLGLPSDLAEQAHWLTVLMMILATVTFLLADRMLGRLTLLWRHRLRKRFFR